MSKESAQLHPSNPAPCNAYWSDGKGWSAPAHSAEWDWDPYAAGDPYAAHNGKGAPHGQRPMGRPRQRGK